MDSDVKISDVNGWANWTGVSGTVYVKVKWYGAWVNGTFSVEMDSNKIIYVRCHIFDIVDRSIANKRKIKQNHFTRITPKNEQTAKIEW